MKRLVAVSGLLALLILFGTEAFAQYGSARGKVVDDKDQPMPDVAILIEYQGGVNRKLEIKTNKKGEFTQVGIGSGVYRFTAQKEGYRGTYLDYKINLGEATELPVIKLTPVTAGRGGGGVADKSTEELKALLEKADGLIQAGKMEEAEAAYKEAVAKNASIPEIHLQLGKLAVQRKDWPAAEAALLKALEIRSDYADAKFVLADVYQKSGQPQKAADLLSKAAGENAGDASTVFNLGVVHLNAARHAEALAAFEKVIALEPTNAEAYYYIGTTQMNLGKLPEAVAALEKYVGMNPKNAANLANAQGLIAALKPKK